MCGRFNQSSPVEDIAKYFSTNNTVDYTPSFNVTPSSYRPIIRSYNNKTEMALCHWGLVPSWAKDKKLSPINAKAETVREKPFFRSAYKSKRCIVPINGFYEWQGSKGNKTPYYIYPKSESFFGLAGLWDSREDPDGTLVSFTIITTAANTLMQTIHHRMPVILDKHDYQTWLNYGDYEFLKPYPSDLMSCHEVSTKINKPSNDSQELIAPQSRV